jgi:D-alanine transaminase
VNGRYRPYQAASVHVEDRGLMLGDAVYEVCAIRAGKILDLDPHLRRLDRSLTELRISAPMSRASLEAVIEETVRRNAVENGLIYMQVSGGVAQRDHVFPDPAPPPGLFVLVRPVNAALLDAKAEQGVSVVSAPDIRWGRRDIKSTGLLANVLAKQTAKELGAGDVWFVDQHGLITEASAANAWIVDAQGTLRTKDLSNQILAGVTRGAILSLASACGLPIEERPFSAAEVRTAQEAFSTSAVALVVPVTQFDDVTIGSGRPGPVAIALRQSYLDKTILRVIRDA